MKAGFYLSCATLLLLALPGSMISLAEEGMWTFDNPPLQRLKRDHCTQRIDRANGRLLGAGRPHPWPVKMSSLGTDTRSRGPPHETRILQRRKPVRAGRSPQRAELGRGPPVRPSSSPLLSWVKKRMWGPRCTSAWSIERWRPYPLLS